MSLNKLTTSTAALQAEPMTTQAGTQANLRPNAPWCPDTWHQTLSQITDHNSLSSALLAALNGQKDESQQGDAA